MSTTTTKATFRLNRTEFERQVRLGSEGNGEGIHTLLTLECVDSDTIDRLLRDCCEKKILVSDGDREIRVLSTNLEYGDTIAVLIASYVGFAEFTHTVASMLYGLTDLVGKELWNLADQDTERTWAVLEAVTHIANQVPEQLKESEACLERKIRRRQEGVWKVTNHVPGEVPTVSEFTDYEEAAAECESLTIQIESDRAIDDQAHGVFDQAAVTGRVVDAIRRLERFRRGETREWQLDQVDDQPTVTLEYIASGADCE